ncbi:MFS transporter [Rathayibacter toxicus]|uniref:Major facilitator superfamily (MFS) profile domain-containing protein n=3 Tax=Rathayibacter toxicus TaxID=145458 RepID=A0A0C5B8B2_9MICO|nr:hypothetical protein TI83_01375 [Rathayibacter toxicus]ALS57225.1 hypothetical protein APU90_05115 [Rathayibacter toxicus]KKM47248.1 hypothetical protein VT73_00710 [Rathayibacter toxicus]PPG24055.1 MFS transporter [Rathayibacter toxicus]PPG48093.1 MFS transporter [Rathayibacter toxicus]
MRATLMGKDPARPKSERFSYIALMTILFTGQFIAIFDISVANVLLPTIQGQFDVTSALGGLVVTAYSATYAGTVILAGRLSDSYGFSRIYLWGVGIFGVASLGCAFAPGFSSLVIFRAIQGVGAGLLFPQVLAGVQGSIPPSWRGVATGIFGVILGAGSTLGQLGGALLSEVDFLGSGWRLAFLINGPTCAAILVGGYFLFAKPTKEKLRFLDIRGAILSCVSLGSFVLAIAFLGAKQEPWLWISLLFSSLVLAILFWCHENHVWMRGKDSIIRKELLRNRMFIRGICITFAFFVTQVPFYVVLTQAIQVGTNSSPLESAALYAPLGIAFIVASSVAGRVRSSLNALLSFFAASVLALTFLCLTAIPIKDISAANLNCVALMTIIGLAGGCIAPSIVRLTLSGIESEYAGSASGLVAMTQQLANSVGTATMALLFALNFGSVGPLGDLRGNLITLALTALGVAVLVGFTHLAIRRAGA